MLAPLLVDPSEYDQEDLFNTFRMLPALFQGAIDGDEVRNAETVLAMKSALGLLAEKTLTKFPDDASVAQRIKALLERFDARDGVSLPRSFVEVCLRDVLDAIRTAGRANREASRGVGVADGLFASDGGVPKRKVDHVEIGARGLVGDRQKHRQHHGRPFQAVCLWTKEVIEALQAEGHPIHAGYAGENISIAGLAWDVLRPGLMLAAGSVVLEISAFAEPCSFNAPWFADRKFSRINQDRHPGWSRTYAWVLVPGAITMGDPVVLEPQARA